MRVPAPPPDRSAAPSTPPKQYGLVTLLAVSVLMALPAPQVGAQSALGFLDLEERLVERQLEVELADYRRARSREQEARARVTEVSDALDQALSNRAAIDRLSGLQTELEAARAREAAAVMAVDRLVGSIAERRQRLELLRDELRRRRGGPADVPDPITGTWRLTLEGGGPERGGERTGLLDLELQATDVRGTLGLEDGTFGSVRGTFIRGDLALERVSADEGLDLILEGTYDPGDETLGGTWRAAIAGLGNPGGGNWSAVRAEPAQDE